MTNAGSSARLRWGSLVKHLSVSPTGITPGRKHRLVCALFVLSMITYVDRTSVSIAKEPISTQLNLSDRQMGMVFSSFALGYSIMQIPAGWLADKVGPRAVLSGAVAFWSVLTALTGAAWSFTSLLIVRFLFGAGEAAVFPGSARAIHNWLQPGERGRANGALFAGSRLGAAFSYPLIVWMLSAWSWRLAFFVLGCAGVAWSTAWLVWFRNSPPNARTAQLPFVDATARDGVNKRALSAPVYFALFQYFSSNFTNFICLSWMFPYLKTHYHLTSSSAAEYSMAPLLFGAMSQGLTGWAMDRMYSSSLRTWSRRLPGVLGFALAASGLLGLTRAGSVGMAVLAFTIAIFGADMTISPSWVFCADIGGERTGRLSGALNMFGSIGAFASANAFPFLNQETGSSSAYFMLAALLDVMGLLCWLRMTSVPGRFFPHGAYSSESGR
jgi:ACS family glucarate transporter-like MFS transporter